MYTSNPIKQDNNDIGHLPVEKILQYEYEFLKRRSKRLESWNEHFSNTKSQNLKNSMTIRTVRLFRTKTKKRWRNKMTEKLGVLLVDVPEPRRFELFYLIKAEDEEWCLDCSDSIVEVADLAYKCTQEEAEKYPQFRWVSLEVIKNIIGYEIEKEKLYTAMLKISGEYLRIDCNGNFDHFRVCKKYILDGARGYRFTVDDLVKYHILGNYNYEVEEVEE